MSRFSALLLGLLTAIPYAYLGVFLYVLMPQMQDAASNDQTRSSHLFMLTLWLHMGAIALFLALTGFYIRYTGRSAHVPKADRERWFRLLLFANFGVVPLFWYLYVWLPIWRTRGSRLTSA